MSYEKQNFENGNVLTAEQLNHMEAGISNSVSVTEQNLTEAQKAQARANIGITLDNSVATVSGDYLEITDITKTPHNVNINLSSDTIEDFSNVEVTCSSKNLFKPDDVIISSSSASTLTVTVNDDGSIRAVNTSTVTKVCSWIVPIPKGKDITVSVVSDGETDAVSIYRYDKSTDTKSHFKNIWPQNENSCTLTNAPTSHLFISANNMAGADVTYAIQVEVGEKTEYETPKVTRYLANANGVVNNVRSVYPKMIIFADTDEVIVNAEYKIDALDNGLTEEEVLKIVDDAKQEVLESMKPKSKVSGYKMAIIGDSISCGVSSHYYENSGTVVTAASTSSLLTTAGVAWWQLVKNRYGIADVVNNSVSGASFARDGSTNNPRFTTYLNETALAADTDIVMIFGGTNDWGVNVPLGDLTDAASTENTATFCAAVKEVLEYLTSNFAEKEIVFITPMQRWFRTWNTTDGERNYTNADYDNDDKSSIEKAFYNCRNGVGLYLRDYVEKLKQLCADYGVTVCDLFSTSQMYMNNEAFKLKYAPDGLHPNELGTSRYTQNGIFPTLDKLWLYQGSDEQTATAE